MTFDHCQGTTKAGLPCRTTLALSDDGLCRVHDPKRADEMRAIQSKGAKQANSSRRAAREARDAMRPAGQPKAPTTLDQVITYRAWAQDEHAAGRMTDDGLRATAYNLLGQTNAIKLRDDHAATVRRMQEKIVRLEQRLAQYEK